MKKIFLVLSLLLSMTVQAVFWDGTDVPLLDDFVIDENESFSFDTPEGQILTLAGRTKTTVEKVRSFYVDSLTALGWQQKTPTIYHRDQDELILKMSPDGKRGTRLQLQLTFANK